MRFNKFELFIYKIFYVIFSFYSKYKSETPWFSATLVLTVCCCSLIVSVLIITGLFVSFMDSLIIGGYSHKISNLIVSVAMVFSIWRLLSYLLFRKMEVSKSDGKNPYYDFDPAKKDKILVSIYLAAFSLSPLYVMGLEFILIFRKI